jgi:hypothetical protein
MILLIYYRVRGFGPLPDKKIFKMCLIEKKKAMKKGG